MKPYSHYFFVGLLKNIPFQLFGRNTFLPDLNLVFVQQVTVLGQSATRRTRGQQTNKGHAQEKKSFMLAAFGKESSIHPEWRLNTQLVTGFQEQDIFVPSHKDNFNPYK